MLSTIVQESGEHPAFSDVSDAVKAHVQAFVCNLDTDKAALIARKPELSDEAYMVIEDELDWEREKILNLVSHPERLSPTQRFLLDNNLWKDAAFRTLWADPCYNFNSPRGGPSDPPSERFFADAVSLRGQNLQRPCAPRHEPPELPSHVHQFFSDAGDPVHWDIWSHQWMTWDAFFYRYSKKTAATRFRIGGWSEESLVKAWKLCPVISTRLPEQVPLSSQAECAIRGTPASSAGAAPIKKPPPPPLPVTRPASSSRVDNESVAVDSACGAAAVNPYDPYMEDELEDELNRFIIAQFRSD